MFKPCSLERERERTRNYPEKKKRASMRMASRNRKITAMLAPFFYCPKYSSVCIVGGWSLRKRTSSMRFFSVHSNVVRPLASCSLSATQVSILILESLYFTHGYIYPRPLHFFLSFFLGYIPRYSMMGYMIRIRPQFDQKYIQNAGHF